MNHLTIQGIRIVGASCSRISSEERNPSLFYYDVRHDDSCLGNPCSISPRVMINHWGTVITAEPINFDGDTILELTDEEGEMVNEALATLSH